MRNRFAELLYQHATADPRIFTVVADISPAGSMERFRQEFPERFINVGVAEQSMIGICAGLALRGCRPFAYTIATFTIYRPFEMIRDDLCYQDLPVVLVGMGAGITYSTLGGTHHAQEDIGVLSALPNMTILAPCDALEMESSMKHCMVTDHPLYLRIGKAGEPIVTADAEEAFSFGKARLIKRGSDLLLLSYGPIMAEVFQLAARLETAGRSVAVASVPTLKPLDQERIGKLLYQYPAVAVIEEHSPHGGLAAQTKQIAWDCQAPCKLETFTLQDEFIHVYGSHEDLRKAHGLDFDLIAERLSAIS